MKGFEKKISIRLKGGKLYFPLFYPNKEISFSDWVGVR